MNKNYINSEEFLKQEYKDLPFYKINTQHLNIEIILRETISRYNNCYEKEQIVIFKHNENYYYLRAYFNVSGFEERISQICKRAGQTSCGEWVDWDYIEMLKSETGMYISVREISLLRYED